MNTKLACQNFAEVRHACQRKLLEDQKKSYEVIGLMDKKLNYFLPDEAASAYLAQSLAKLMLEYKFYPTIFLIGELGAGKTFFSRHFCLSLPNSHLADISSPSFSLVNHYTTQPELIHADLYRLNFGDIPDELDEAIENPKQIAIIEWADMLTEQYFALEHLEIILRLGENSRQATLSANTQKTRALLSSLNENINQTIQAIGG